MSEARAKPLPALATCTGTSATSPNPNPNPNALCDVATGLVQRPQDLSGNSLPQAPRNKVAVAVTYNWEFERGTLSRIGDPLARRAQCGDERCTPARSPRRIRDAIVEIDAQHFAGDATPREVR